MKANLSLAFSVEELTDALQGLEQGPSANARYIGVVRRLYGIGGPPARMADLARELKVSRQRILQIRDKTLTRCDEWLTDREWAVEVSS